MVGEETGNGVLEDQSLCYDNFSNNDSLPIERILTLHERTAKLQCQNNVQGWKNNRMIVEFEKKMKNYQIENEESKKEIEVKKEFTF